MELDSDEVLADIDNDVLDDNGVRQVEYPTQGCGIVSEPSFSTIAVINNSCTHCPSISLAPCHEPVILVLGEAKDQLIFPFT